jgi:hypothetical protein
MIEQLLQLKPNTKKKNRLKLEDILKVLEPTELKVTVRRNTYLQSGFFVVFPDSRHSLVSSGILGTQIL